MSYEGIVDSLRITFQDLKLNNKSLEEDKAGKEAICRYSLNFRWMSGMLEFVYDWGAKNRDSKGKPSF